MPTSNFFASVYPPPVRTFQRTTIWPTMPVTEQPSPLISEGQASVKMLVGLAKQIGNSNRRHSQRAAGADSVSGTSPAVES